MIELDMAISVRRTSRPARQSGDLFSTGVVMSRPISTGDYSPARKYLDELHTVGLVDYIGREYTLTYNSLSRAIELMLIPRITDTLRTIARGASSGDSTTYSFTPRGADVSGAGEIVKETGLHMLNQRMVDMWYQRGKKVKATAMNNLTIRDDIDVDMLDSVLDQLLVHNKLTIPKDMFERLAYKIRIHGSVETV